MVTEFLFKDPLWCIIISHSSLRWITDRKATRLPPVNEFIQNKKLPDILAYAVKQCGIIEQTRLRFITISYMNLIYFLYLMIDSS